MLLLTAVCSVAAVSAQDDDLLRFFPNTEGSQLVNQTFDANNNLLATTTYTILESYQYYAGQSITVGYRMTDAAGAVLDQGSFFARYDDGNFYLGMKNHALIPNFMNYLSAQTELTGDFLDYPDTFHNYPWESDFQMDGGELVLKDKENNRESVRIRTRERKYEGNESITTPAKQFDASKISFEVDVIEDGRTTTYKGVEWYAVGAGIVRSEIRDSRGNLMNYTVLTQLIEK